MPMSHGIQSDDEQRLERLNRLSLTRSFVPQVDIDWGATTTDAEYESLYSSWSLFEGTGMDNGFDAARRVKFVKYQQANLMIFSGLLELYALTALIKLYETTASEAWREYLSHFIKEESYHATMFRRAAQQIYATMPDCKPLPVRSLDRVLKWIFCALNALPGKKLRSNVTFTFFRFGELVTLYAHQMVQSKIHRKQSLIRQVWTYHALDESRHLAFDAIVLKQTELGWPLSWAPPLLAAPCSALVSVLVNANEIWAARQLGLPARWWQLPGLMKRTQAPFKRRVFGLWTKSVAGCCLTSEEI